MDDNTQNNTSTNNSPTTANTTSAVVTGNNDNVSISSIIEDNSGGLSATRVLLLAWGIGVLVIWGFATVMSVIHGVYTGIPIPDSVVTILLGITGGKVVQRFGER